jgi:drug/metabolite transporter (DMT)-like permease
MTYLGELCALGAAVAWTVSSSTFAVASKRVGPMPTNHFRLWAALPILFVVAAGSSGHWWPVGIDGWRLGLLALSGVVGLVLGDFGYFVALARIGPRVASVVMTTWPAFTLLFAWLGGEVPDGAMLFGVALTIGGVLLVLQRAREGSSWNPGLSKQQWWWGLAGALLGAFGQALGVVLARQAMQPSDGEGGVAPLDATLVRMVAGVAGAQLVAILQGRPADGVRVLGDRRATLGALVGTLFGPVLGIWLSMMATRHAREVGVASALMATTPLFLMPIAALCYGARIGWRGLVGTLLAVGGAALLFAR